MSSGWCATQALREGCIWWAIVWAGCAPRWGERNATWRRPEPLGIIAGTLPLGLGWMTGRLPGRSDGVVRVEETLVEGMAQQVTVPVAHSALIASRRVAGLVGRFLAAGRFE